MRIAFVWTGVTSYMADCWRRLSVEQGVELKVWIDASSASAKAVDFDADRVMLGIEHAVLGTDTQREIWGLTSEVVGWKPDVLFVVGWRSAICRAVVEGRQLKDVPKVCCFDMPWRWQLRCIFAPIVLRRFLRNYQAAFVPGRVCERYAKWLGFKKIYKGLFAIDTGRFSKAEEQRDGRYFLYVGRNSEEKRLDDLRKAHSIYRTDGGKLPLKLYGKGLDCGFVKPEDVPALMKGAAAFVLASDFDPWPLVLLEAMSAGCSVIASDKCTNRPELGKNWRVFHVGDVKALALAMMDREESGSDSERIKMENLELAQKYDCVEWVRKVEKIVKEVVKC